MPAIPVIVRMESRGPGKPRAPLLVFPASPISHPNTGNMVVCSFIDGHSEASTAYLWSCPQADEETAQSAIARYRSAYPHTDEETYLRVARDTPAYRAARTPMTRGRVYVYRTYRDTVVPMRLSDQSAYREWSGCFCAL